MTEDHLVKQAYRRLVIASEKLAQAAAVQSFSDQGLLGNQLAHDEIVHLVSEFSREADEISRLLERFLQDGDRSTG